MAAMARPAVVTGLGALTPLGLDLPATWAALLAGRSGVAPAEGIEVAGLPPVAVGRIRGFDPTTALTPDEVRKGDRFVHLVLAAAKEAISDARLHGDFDPDRAGAIVGCGRGGLPAVERAATAYQRRGGRGVSPHFSVHTLPSMAAAAVARAHRLHGPCFGVATACASGSHAIAEAAHCIARGEAEVVVTGGVEAVVTPIMLAGFARAGVLAPAGNDPAACCRPFDRSRAGFCLGEGACCLVLESEAHARGRGARIYGRVAGSGMTCDAHHPTTPDPEGRSLARAITAALTAADLAPDDLDYLSAHGTGTRLNDPAEAAAIHRGLGPAAETTPISAIKGATGHLLGASGAVEAAVCLLTLYHGIAPATRNLTDPDPACPLAHITGAPRRGTYRAGLSLSAGFGGLNAALLFTADCAIERYPGGVGSEA